MEIDVKQRMKLIMKEFNTNPTQLSLQFEVNQKTLNSHINGETAVSLSTILLILEAFPNLSAEWLLRGKGEMIIQNDTTNNFVSADDAELVGLSRDLVRLLGKIMDKTNKK